MLGRRPPSSGARGLVDGGAPPPPSCFFGEERLRAGRGGGGEGEVDGRIGGSSDASRLRYTALADDGGGCATAEGGEAQRLLAKAEGHLQAGEAAEALASADLTLELLRRSPAASPSSASSAAGLAVAAERRLGGAAQAARRAEKELGAFRATGDRLGEVVMLLALSSAALEDAAHGAAGGAGGAGAGEASASAVASRGASSPPPAPEIAARRAEEALEIARVVGHNRSEAAALLAVAEARLAGERYAEVVAAAEAALVASSKNGPGAEAGHGGAGGSEAGPRHPSSLLLQARSLRAGALGHLALGEAEKALASARRAWALLSGLKEEAREEAAYALELVAHVHLQRGRPDEALPAAREAQASFEALGLLRGEQLALASRSAALLARGDAGGALKIGQEFLDRLRAQRGALGTGGASDLATARSAARAEAGVLVDLVAPARSAQGDLGAAAAAAAEALGICRGERLSGDRRAEAVALDAVASICALRGQGDQAAILANEALELFATQGDLLGEGIVQYRLCGIHHLRGDHSEALRAASQGRELFGRAGRRASEISATLAEACARRLLGDHAAASSAVGLAVAAAREIGDRMSEASALAAMVSLYLSDPKGSDLGAARLAASQAEAVLRPAQGGPFHGSAAACGLLAYALQLGAVANLHAGEPEAAAAPAQEAHVLFLRAKDKSGEAECLRLLVCADLEIIFRDRRRLEEEPKLREAILRRQAAALRNAERAVDLARSALAPGTATSAGGGGGTGPEDPTSAGATAATRSSGHGLLAFTLHALAQARAAAGRAEAAAEAAEEAAALFEALDDRERQASALIAAADAFVLGGRRSAAQASAGKAGALFEELGDAAGQELARSVLRGLGGGAGRLELGHGPPPGEAAAAEADGGGADSAAVAAPRPTMSMEDAVRIAKEIAISAIGDTDAIDLDSPLMDLGLDSLSAISFRETLAVESGVKLPTSLVFDYPSLQAVAMHMVEVSAEA